MNPQTPVLEVQGLRKGFQGIHALHGVDLTIQRGQVFGLLGPNGAGKTTFTKCITGFIHRDAGEVRVCGVDPEQDPVGVGTHIGLVPDQYDFYPWMTGRQQLDFYASLHRIPAQQRNQRIEEVLQLVDMTDRADRRLKGYSHGMKQRICIAQAILHRPALVVLDEPTNGLDPKGAYELRNLIRSIARQGTSILLNSHLMHEVEEVCDHVTIIDQGKVVVSGSVSDLRRDHAGGDRVRVRLQAPSRKVLAAAQAVAPGTKAVGPDTLEAPIPPSQTTRLLDALLRAGGQVVDVQRQETRLEDLFLRLTEAPT